MTSDGDEVAEVVECFEADWSRQTFEPRRGSNLIWCPGGRERVAEFIDHAKHSLFVQNERFQDAMIVERLVRAKLRGVKIHIVARPSHSLRAKKLVEGLGDLHIVRESRHRNSQGPTPEAARQDAVGGQVARANRFDQSERQQLRRSSGTRHPIERPCGYGPSGCDHRA